MERAAIIVTIIDICFTLALFITVIIYEEWWNRRWGLSKDNSMVVHKHSRYVLETVGALLGMLTLTADLVVICLRSEKMFAGKGYALIYSVISAKILLIWYLFSIVLLVFLIIINVINFNYQSHALFHICTVVLSLLWSGIQAVNSYFIKKAFIDES